MQEVKGVKIGESMWNYTNELLTLEILENHISNSFKFLKLLYNRPGDSEDHLAHYKNHMNLLGAFDEVKCRAFSITLPQITQ